MKPRSFKVADRATLMRVSGALSQLIVSEKRPLLIEVCDFKQPKTRQQEKLFHSILGEVAEDVVVNGRKFSLESWKEYFARKYLGVVEIVMPDGEIVTRRRSTAEANIGEYNILIDKTLAELASDFGYLAEMVA
jgi:hypothetical protein